MTVRPNPRTEPSMARVGWTVHCAFCDRNSDATGESSAMAMYVADYERYLALQDLELLGQGQGALQRTWADRSYPYAPLAWTNVSWHCPTYIASGGLVSQKVVPPRALRGPPITGLSIVRWRPRWLGACERQNRALS